MAGERTEAPTGKRRAEAREKGQVAKSPEIASVAILFAGLLTLNARSGDLLYQFRQVSREAFMQVGSRDAEPQALLAMAISMMVSGALAIAPFVLTVAAVGIVANAVQVGPMLSLQSIKPDFGKVNPLNGMKRFWSGRSLVELAKAMAKLGVMGLVAYQVIRERFAEVVGLQSASAEAALGGMGNLIMDVTVKCGLALVVMAAADYVYQKRSFESSLKMSKDDVKEEARQTEGNPQLKGKIRQMARQLASRRMMQSVPHADVVVTNPTHYAVAIEYKPQKMSAPVVTAKGQMLMAEQIKRVAREHGVPVVENPPLARALYRSVDVGTAVPPAMYQAVAEVLAFIYRLRDSRGAIN